MSIFFDFLRSSLYRSKKYSFLSRKSKKFSFWLFWLKKKNIWRKGQFFDKNHELTALENVDFFRLCENFTYEMQKALFSIQNNKECFFLAFLARKKTYEKRSIFWQKPWTNPFAKERFFFDFVRTSLLRSKELFFLSRISKNVSLWLFAKKETYQKKVDFLTKTMN